MISDDETITVKIPLKLFATMWASGNHSGLTPDYQSLLNDVFDHHAAITATVAGALQEDDSFWSEDVARVLTYQAQHTEAARKLIKLVQTALLKRSDESQGSDGGAR